MGWMRLGVLVTFNGFRYSKGFSDRFHRILQVCVHAETVMSCKQESVLASATMLKAHGRLLAARNVTNDVNVVWRPKIWKSPIVKFILLRTKWISMNLLILPVFQMHSSSHKQSLEKSIILCCLQHLDCSTSLCYNAMSLKVGDRTLYTPKSGAFWLRFDLMRSIESCFL